MTWTDWLLVAFGIYCLIGLVIGIYMEYQIRHEKNTSQVIEMMKKENIVLCLIISMLVGVAFWLWAYVWYLYDRIKHKR